MNSITEESGKQSPKAVAFQRSRLSRSVGSPSLHRHGRKSKHENDLKREEQLQAYTAWVNSQLKKRPGSRFIQDLPRDMKDGVALIQLIEVVAGEKLPINEHPVALSSMKENVEQVLNFMAVNQIRMHHISAKEILEGNLKATMRLILALAAHFKPGSVKQSAHYQTAAVPTTGKKIARTPSAAAAASEAAAAIAEASRAAASVGRHINSRYRRHKDVLSTPTRESRQSPKTSSEGTPMLPSAESPLLSTPRTGSQSSREGKSGRSTPGSGSATPKGHVFCDGSEHSGSDVDSGLMCSQNKTKENRLSGLTAEFLNELSGEQDAIHDELGETKHILLGLQKILLDGRIKEDEVPEEYSFIEGTDLKDQLAIMNARLSQLSAEYDILKTERNNYKEDCVSLLGVKSGLTSRLTQQEEAIMHLKSELLKSSFTQQSRDGEVMELERKIDEKDAEISALRAELLRQERTIDKQRAELEDTLRGMENMRYAEASSSRHYSPDDSQIHELHQRIATLQEKLRNVASHEADISSRITNQDQKMKSLEDKIISPQSVQQPALGPPRTEELELVRETIKNLRDSFHSNDSQQHTLDALEQTFTSLIMRQTGSSINNKMNGIEYNDVFGYVRPLHKNVDGHSSRSFEKDSSGASTKILYFTENTVTPFLTTIPKRLGNITLRDFKKLFDRPGPYRFHFKALDPEFGTVKEEVIDDDDVIPGWEGKIVAWVEEDRGLIALNHHDNNNYDVNMNEN